MALAAISQDVGSHTVRHFDPPLKPSTEPHKNGLLWGPPSLYLVRQLLFEFLTSSWTLNSMSMEFVPHLFLCPARPCVRGQHAASVICASDLSGRWQGGPE